MKITPARSDSDGGEIVKIGLVRQPLDSFSFCGKRGIDFVATSCLLVFPFARRGAPCKSSRGI